MRIYTDNPSAYSEAEVTGWLRRCTTQEQRFSILWGHMWCGENLVMWAPVVTREILKHHMDADMLFRIQTLVLGQLGRDIDTEIMAAIERQLQTLPARLKQATDRFKAKYPDRELKFA